MRVCPECGQENPEGFRLCGMCGAALEAPAVERRKLATLLFCDMSGSTAMGERVDAESVREMMFSYFHEMRGAIERHGGTVEKFIGDAVMAVFGVPTAHEDDALRAVRAAWEMQARMADLNAELERRYGSTIALRIGVNTGEVVAGDTSTRQTLVTGDAVNVAARLEQAASPGEVLIGEPTYRLVRDAVRVEPVEPLSLKGKSEPLPAFRLTAVLEGAPARARKLDTPMVGRADELALLRALLGRALGERRCLLATIVGEPGAGKSRLALAVLDAAASDFRILSGRCLPYGEGITYWPIGEIVREAAGIRDEHSRDEALSRLEALTPGEDGAIVAQAIGLAEGQAGTDDIARAVGSLFGALARERPLLLFVDDIHWAELSLLELLASLPARNPQVPLVALSLARPELLEAAPAWEATVRLQPLEQAESTRLVEQLLGVAALPRDLAERIVAAAAGNPLFVEELVGMLIDDGLLQQRNGGWAVEPGLAELAIPRSLQELLGARLDRLPAEERSVLERGAVEGQVFHRGAVLALSEPGQEASISESLQTLIEREYLRPARADFADESAFRVRHVLIRDAAYEGVPKKRRASHHERLVDWLEAKAGERAVEYDEVLGHHLERAYRYRAELGPLQTTDEKLALRAAGKLERAGRRALDRRDARAIVNLMSRAADLLPRDEALRFELLQFVVEELGYMGEFERSYAVAREVLEGADAHEDVVLGARARLFASLMRFWLEEEFGVEEMLAETNAVQAICERFGHPPGIARAHDLRALVLIHMGRFEAAQRDAEEAIHQFRRLGDRRSAVEQFWYLGWTAAYGPMTVAAGVEQCHAILEEAGDDAAVEGHTRYSLARLEAKRGRFDEARDQADRALTIFDEIGMAFSAWHPLCRGEIELLAGNASAAENELRRGLEALGAMFVLADMSNCASWLADLLVGEERLEEADGFAARAEEWAPKDQAIQHARWRAARARILARREAPEAEGLAREAIELSQQTDFLELQADCLVALADVLRVAGRDQDAVPALEEALQLYERKGNRPFAERTRARLAELSSAS